MADIKENETGEEKSFDSAGYCPYTEDRRCKTGKTGGWSDGERCDECGYRCW